MYLLNIWGHITTVSACISGTLTDVLPHRNVMTQTQDTTTHPVTIYRHMADLSLCNPLMWNVTLEYTATHFNVLGETQPGNPSRPSTHTPANVQFYDAVVVEVSRKLGRKYNTYRVLNLWCANPLHYPLAHSCFLCVLELVYTEQIIWMEKFCPVKTLDLDLDNFKGQVS